MRAKAALGSLLVGLVLVGCSPGPQRRAEVEDDARIPFQLLDADAPRLRPVAGSAASGLVTLCYLDENGLVEVEAELPRTVRGGAGLVAALADVPEGAPGSLRTAVGSSFVRDVTIAAGIARVDLRPEIAEVDGDDQLLGVAQLVCTLTGRPGVGLVSFTLDGSPVDVPRADGSLTSSPVSRDDYADLLS